MKYRLIILNVILIPMLLCFIGGGALYYWGYPFLLLFIATYIIIFPQSYIKKFITQNYTFALSAFLLYFFISSYLDIPATLAQFTFFSPIYIYHGIIRIINKDKSLERTQRFFVYLWIIIYLLYCVTAYQFLQIDPMGMRRLASVIKDDSIIVGGGYILIYALCVLVPAIIQTIFRCNSIKAKLFYLISSCFMFFIVVKSLFTTAIIICILGIIWTLLAKKSTIHRIIWLSTIVIIGFLVYESIPTILSSLSDDDNNVLFRRFIEIDSILAGNDLSQSEDLYSRITLLLSSIETFFRYPLFGVGPLVNFSFYEMEKLGVGSHAEWFDIFARYGLFGILLIIFIYKAASQSIKKTISFGLFIMLGFLNPVISFSIIFVTFCLAPLLTKLGDIENHMIKPKKN